MEGEGEVMRYGSVCSGIEAASAAWAPLGWRASFFSEIEPFPRAVLTHRYPNVPLHGDFTTIESNQYEPIDLLVGGTPCQSFSVAGLRGGLADDRGNLALGYLRLAQRTWPRWLVWENVPGVLSSNGGRDFGAILGGMVELGYGIAYRVLDAQYFGVAQRRRRVFVVGYLGDWRRAAAVLFERHSLSGHPAPRREAGQRPAPSVIKGAAIGRQPSAGPQYGEHLSDGSVYTLNCTEQHAVVAPTLSARTKGGGGLGTDFDCDGGLIAHAPCVSPALKARDYKGPSSDGDGDGAPLIAHTLRGEGFDASEDGSGRGTPLVPVAFTTEQTPKYKIDCALCLTKQSPTGGGQPQAVATAAQVRRLTPRECERLQGFPDDWTAIPWRGKLAAECPDGPRYKVLGNSMAVPVMRWIGERIAQVEALA